MGGVISKTLKFLGRFVYMKVQSPTNFLDYLTELAIPVDDSFIGLLEKSKDSFSFISLKKNEYFVKEGEVCKYFCFVESGILQHSVVVDDEEKTTYLALRNSVTTSLNSFLLQKPSRKNIKAISDCALWIVDLKTFKNLVESNEAFHQFYYNLIEKQLCLIDDYRIDLLTLSPEERYHKLLATEPKLLQEVPLHYLSSFLGISTRHMSRIRKNIK